MMAIRAWLFLVLHALLIIVVLEWPGCVHMVSASERTTENADAALAVSNSKSSIVQRRLVESSRSRKGFGIPGPPLPCFVNLTCSLYTPLTPICCRPLLNGIPIPSGFGNCVDILSSAEQCGNCANDCTKQGLFSCCLGKCVNYTNDINNCGGCGITCPSGGLYRCCLGRCINILSDDSNCGSCGIKCSGTSTSSQCPTSPPPPFPFQSTGNNICCLGKCTDVFNDRSNCGGCGVDLTQLSTYRSCSRGKPIVL